VSKEKSHYVYDVELNLIGGNTIISHIDAHTDENGDQILNIIENEKTDELRFSKNGEIFLDGEVVLVEETKFGFDSENSIDPGIAPKAAKRIYWQTGSPYDPGSYYTNQVGTTKKVLTASKVISAMTVAALVAIVISVLALTGGTAAIFSVIASGAIAYFSKNNPKAKAFSLKDVTYVHRTKGFNVTSKMSVYKHHISYYANTNYTGLIDIVARFQVFAY